jgi:predicted nucleic-acid-binding protein
VIAVDTNVLVRYLVQDDAAQGELARRLLEEEATPETPGYVTIVAVLELDWVLRGSYGFGADVVASVIAELMTASNLVFENAEAVEGALGSPHGDLVDNVLHRVGRAEGCSRTVTFDRTFARLDGVELLGA